MNLKTLLNRRRADPPICYISPYMDNPCSLGQLVSAELRCSSPAAVKDIFGDAYLLQHNRLYKNVRQTALAHGYKFKQKDKILGELPKLLMLRILHEKKIISYAPTKKMVRNSIKGPFKSFSAWKFITNFYTDLANISLHEGAHAMAHSVTRELARANKKVKSPQGERMVFLQLALEESFANTIEFSGFCLNRTPEAEFFYLINSIIGFIGDEAEEVRTLAKITPPYEFVRAAFLCFVFHHFQFDELGAAQLNLIKKYSAVPKTAFIRRLFKATAFNRQGVAASESTYLQFCGIKLPFAKILELDVTRELERNPSILSSYDLVLRAAVEGIKSFE